MMTEEARIEQKLERAKAEGFDQMLSHPTVALLMSTVSEDSSEVMKALMRQAFSSGVDKGVAVFVVDVLQRAMEQRAR
jgi:hypothetical protein